MELKFRAWHHGAGDPRYQAHMNYSESVTLPIFFKNVENEDMAVEVMQFYGLTTDSGQDMYSGDIGEFENGDRFVLKVEDWLEVCVDWIGEPRCEDQARDLYRITRAKVIGNIHQHPELMESNNEGTNESN